MNVLNKQQRSPLDLSNKSILKSSSFIDGNHALHITDRKYDIEDVKLLVGCGADVNKLNEKRQNYYIKLMVDSITVVNCVLL